MYIIVYSTIYANILITFIYYPLYYNICQYIVKGCTFNWYYHLLIIYSFFKNVENKVKKVTQMMEVDDCSFYIK